MPGTRRVSQQVDGRRQFMGFHGRQAGQYWGTNPATENASAHLVALLPSAFRILESGNGTSTEPAERPLRLQVKRFLPRKFPKDGGQRPQIAALNFSLDNRGRVA